MKTPLPQLALLCKRYGLALSYKPFDGPTLMYALAMVESSEGENCAPRHEAGYCRGGKYFDHVATEQWNCLAHMSYGEWQVMWANLKVSPIVLLSDAEIRAKLSSLFIADLALRASQAGLDLKASLALFAHHYNGPEVAQKYIDDLMAAYEKGMPGAKQIELHLADGNHTPLAIDADEIKREVGCLAGTTIYTASCSLTVIEKLDEVKQMIAEARSGEAH